MGSTSSSSHFMPVKLPIDASTLALCSDACHCVADTELANRYNLLRAEEHARIEGKCGPEWSMDVAHLPENAERNRYPNVVPWDHSRVRLPVKDGENDYINASWIELGSRTYIASQGPLPSTQGHFWHMVYAYGGEPAVVIMLTPLHEHAVEKCTQYWPDSKQSPICITGDTAFAFNLEVHLKSTHRNDKYHISTFKLVTDNPAYPPKKVYHVYYHSWLDYSKPDMDADLRELVHIVNNELRNRAAPLIVHCSAGIGRTGTFIALDALHSRIDTDILPAISPRFVPVWCGDQRAIQYRRSLFTGQEDTHSDTDGSPRLSKFDVAAQSTAVSIKTIPELDGQKQPANADIHISKLTQALEEQKFMDAEEEIADGATIDGDGDETTKPFRESTTSAKTGPAIRKVKASVTSVAPEVFSQTPSSIDVMQWYEVDDPVMSTVRTIRLQRPKMVQGKQQLGYIYDQFEVAQQFARATFQHNQQLRRSSSTLSASFGSTPTARTPEPAKPHRLLSLIGVKRSASEGKKKYKLFHTKD